MKTAYDCKHVKSVSAFVILWRGEHAGKVVADFSDNPNGAVCTCTASIWAGPDKMGTDQKHTARAGGYGYDKLCSCLEQIFGGSFGGSEAWAAEMEKKGYKVIRAL